MRSLTILDEAVAPAELAVWRRRVLTGTQSTGLTEGEVAGTELYTLAQRYAPGLALIHCLLFAIVRGHQTELHRDVGEYAGLFYPYDNPSCPLRVVVDGVAHEIDVRANRFVALDCTTVAHQQVVPADESTRYSVAFKFRML